MKHTVKKIKKWYQNWVIKKKLQEIRKWEEKHLKFDERREMYHDAVNEEKQNEHFYLGGGAGNGR